MHLTVERVRSEAVRESVVNLLGHRAPTRRKEKLI
jgi:hypothetical protein